MQKHKIFFDARCLQDPDYKYRGVGRHSSNICIRPPNSKYVLIACCSRSLPPLPPEYEALFDQVLFRFPRNLDHNASIVSLSPMTDSTDFAAREDVGSPLVRATLIYDFIPWDHYGYLNSKAAIDGYCDQISALGNFDLFFPISDYSGRRLSEICRIPSESIVMTGVGVHDEFYSAGSMAGQTAQAILKKFGLKENRYIAFVGGGDPRKNADLVVELAGRYAAKTGGAVSMVIGGHYPDFMRDALTARYRECGGRETGIVFLPQVSDLELSAIYKGSLVTAVASLIEGFSMPVVEAIAAGSIALVSDCDAHLELVSTPETIFSRTDADDALAKLVSIAALDAKGRSRLLARQRATIDRFRTLTVRERFWSAMDKAIATKRVSAPAPLRRRRPRLAFATPWPPQKSGVATYSFNTVKAISRHADVDVYCEVAPADAPPLPGVRLLPLNGRIDQRDYDQTYFVIGNSHFHTPIINQLLESGGSAIIHDSRLFEYYFTLSGGMTSEFFALVRRMTGHEISQKDVELWLRDQRTLPDLFLGDVIDAASNIIVHHPGFVREIASRYRRQPLYIPFAIPSLFEDADLMPEARQAIRTELGLSSNAVSIATFGFVDPIKATTECIFALGELHDWNIPSNLYFVGRVDPIQKEQFLCDARFCGVEHAVHFLGDYVSDDIYRKFLLAADCGIQLRKIGFGQGSGAIAECAAAGMATVANNSIAESAEVPDYVRRVPDNLSPLLIAEQIAKIYEQGLGYERASEERRRYVTQHSFDQYAKSLVEAV